MEQWPSKACRDKNILPAVTTESLCPVEAKPVISHHTEAEALTPRPSDPVLSLSLSIPLRTQPLPHHPFPPQEVFGGSMLLHTPSVSVSLCVVVTLKRTAWLIYADLGAVCQDHACLPRLFLSSILSPQGKSK